MEPPPLVRSGGQAAGEQVLFVCAQAAHVPDSFEHAGDFLFHSWTLRLRPRLVELDMAREFIRNAVKLARDWSAHELIGAGLRSVDKHPVELADGSCADGIAQGTGPVAGAVERHRGGRALGVELGRSRDSGETACT